MSFDPNNKEIDLNQAEILFAILQELKKLCLILSEVSDLNVLDEDVE